MIDAFELAPVTPIDASAGEVTVEIVGGALAMEASLAEAVERRWAEMLAENPRFHNGAILAIESFDPATNTLRARRDEYRRLAVQPQAPTRVRILSVTGMIVARDDEGRECLLLAQRSHQTRIYGGLWELAPSGGIDAPDDRTSSLTIDDVRRQLDAELREELGLGLDLSRARPVALSVDGPGDAVDIILRLDTGTTIERLGLDDARANWEYTGVRWVALDDAREFARNHSRELIPPTRDVLAWLADPGQE
ncbi:MAG: NUDIX domain-containing protein [Phycisphaerales bacterium]